MSARLRELFTPGFVRIWWVAFAAGAAGFLLFPAAPFRLRAIGAPPAAVGWFLGGLTYGSALAAAWMGALGDLLGRRRVLTVAGLLLALLAAAYSFVADWRLLVVLSVGHGVVWSALLTAANAEAIQTIPDHRRAEGIAYFGMAMNLAITVAPAIGLWLLDRGWMQLCAAIVILDLSVVVLAQRLEVDCRRPTDFWQRLAPHRAIDWRTLIVAVGLLLSSFGYGGLTSFVALLAEARGIAPKGIFFTAFALTIIFSRPFLAPLIDRRGARRAIPLALCTVSVGLVLAALPTTRLEMIGVGVVYGLGFSILGPAYTSWIAENASVERRGAAFGALLAAFDLGIGTGSMVLGLVVERWSFAAAFVLSGVFALAAWPYLRWSERVAGFTGRAARNDATTVT